MTTTLIPAYGKDFKTAKAAKESYAANQDWIIADHFNKWDGKPCNKEQMDGAKVMLRFHKLTKTCITS